jgi:hypothetical protein
MPDFMEGYGVQEARRGRLILRLVLASLAAVILGTGGYFYFRTWKQERIMDDFLDKLARKEYGTAYQMWCNENKPCPYYPPEKFLEDWGPSSPYSNVAAADLQFVDYCGDGVLFNFSWKPAPDVILWVERDTGIVGYAPGDWKRCPGKHLQLSGLWDRLFRSN